MSKQKVQAKSPFSTHKAWLFLLLLLSVAAAYYSRPDVWHRIFTLLLSGDLGEIIDYIRSFGPYAMLISFFLIVFINMVAVLPNIFLLAANGILFGILPGTLVSWIAESVGVIISFVVLRYFARDYTLELIQRNNMLQKVDEYSGENGFKIMIIARSIPFVPSGLITALGAISEISLKDYVLATLIGKLPSAFIEVSIGHDLASYHDHMFRLSLFIGVALAAYGLHIWHRRKEKAALAETEAGSLEDISKKP